MLPSPWTEDNVALLKRLYSEGLSTTLISEEFGKLGYAFTRNSVIGKIHRLKLEPPEGKKWTRPKQPVKRRPAEKTVIKLRQYVRPVVEPIVMKDPNPKKNVLLRETEENHCRAIVGYRDGVLADAICCGEEVLWVVNSQGRLVASPWCHYHREKYIEKKQHGRNR